MKNTPIDIQTVQSVFTNSFYSAVIFVLFIVINFLHGFKLDTIPTGLFFDEATIGIQANHINQTGINAYDDYIRTTGDIDSPILIFTTALIFRVFGISEYSLRLPNVLFFSTALILAFWLVKNLFRNNWVIWIYLLIAFGFLPQFFTISRLSFEVVAQLTSLAGLCLCVWWTFHQDSSRFWNYVKPAICGFLIGISIYTYTTAILLSAFFMASLLVIYHKKENQQKLVALIATCLITLIPYPIYSIINPGGFVSRFRDISFLYESLPLIEKVKIFISNYLSHWSLDFLIFHGDANLRHSTGSCGIVYVSVFVLFILGLIGALIRKDFDKFKALLFCNLLFAPIASAMTSEGIPHSLRSFLMGFYLVIFSCFGLQFVIEVKTKLARNILIACIFTFLSYEVYQYQFDYFAHYGARSVDAMGSYDLYGSFEFAVGKNPKEIIFLENFPGDSILYLFYSQIAANPNNIPIRISKVITPEPNICIIFHRLSNAEENLSEFSIPYDQFSSKYEPSPIAEYFGEETFSGLMKARCYKDHT